MSKIKLPYGKKSIIVDIPGDRLEDILISKVNKYSIKKSDEEIVKKALVKLIKMPRLRDLAQGKKRIVIL